MIDQGTTVVGVNSKLPVFDKLNVFLLHKLMAKLEYLFRGNLYLLIAFFWYLLIAFFFSKWPISL